MTTTSATTITSAPFADLADELRGDLAANRAAHMSTVTLTRRDRALLIAAGEGRCDVVSSGVPDLRVDGRWFCDQPRAHALVGAGLLTRASAERSRATVPARLTNAGRAALAA